MWLAVDEVVLPVTFFIFFFFWYIFDNIVFEVLGQQCVGLSTRLCLNTQFTQHISNAMLAIKQHNK